MNPELQTESEKNALLAGVSRSFYLTIRALPKELRHSIRTAYLLARAADTIADTASVPAVDRLSYLQTFRSILLGNMALEESVKIGTAMSPLQSNSAEKVLLAHLPEVLADYASMETADHADVRWVLDQITTGQAEDLVTPHLKDDAALERYTWLVAGCVGEFWTRLGLRKLKNYATLPEAEMIRLGADFGKGLQLVNILRDVSEDASNGRSYLPDIAGYDQWIARANFLLENGWRYVLALNSWRLRFACALPVLIGRRTLGLLKSSPDKARSLKIKISRSEVRRILLQTLVRCHSRKRLALSWKSDRS